jgi:hypothetical protein
MANDTFNRSEKNKRYFIVSILFLFLVLPYVVRMNTLPFPTCLFKSFTNLSCPTCGISRAYYSTARGSIDTALQHNFVGIFIYGGFLFLFFRNILELIRNKRILIYIPKSRFLIFFILIFYGWFSFWIIRLIRESSQLF